MAQPSASAPPAIAPAFDAGVSPRPRGRRAALLACGLAWSALAARFVEHVHGWGPDDFFITYRYARNLAFGHGFTYNPGERVFGTTDPGLGLLLGALHSVLPIDVPLLATLLFAASLVGTALVVASAARSETELLAAALFGTAFVGSSMLWANAGAAAVPVLLLLTVAARVIDRREGLSGGLAALAVWIRPDAAVGLVLLGSMRWIERRTFPVRYAMVAATLVGAGLLLATLWFGQPFPNTLGAKLDMAAAAESASSHWRFWQRAAVPIGRHFGSAAPVLALAAALGCAVALRRASRPARLLILHGATIALAYTALGVPFFSWYVLPCVAAGLLGLAHLCAAATARLGGRALRTGVAAAIYIVLCWPQVTAASGLLERRPPPPRLRTYLEAAFWIRQRTPESASIAYVEIGVLGYYSRRPLVDLMGLVTPEARPFVAAGNLPGALRERPADLVLAHSRGRMNGVIASEWFRARYDLVHVIQEPARGGRSQQLRIFARRSERDAGPVPSTEPGPSAPALLQYGPLGPRT